MKIKRPVGRPAKPENERLVQTVVRLSPDVREKLEAKAETQDMTLSAYVRRLIEKQVVRAKAA